MEALTNEVKADEETLARAKTDMAKKKWGAAARVATMRRIVYFDKEDDDY